MLPQCPIQSPSNSLPSTNPTHKLTIGSSSLPTVAKAVVAPSSTSGPPSTIIPKTQPQRQAENKRRKVVVSSGPPLKPNHKPQKSVMTHPMQPPQHQRQALPYMNQHSPYSDPPCRYYSLEDHSRTNFRRNSYYSNSSHHYLRLPFWHGGCNQYKMAAL